MSKEFTWLKYEEKVKVSTLLSQNIQHDRTINIPNPVVHLAFFVDMTIPCLLVASTCITYIVSGYKDLTIYC